MPLYEVRTTPHYWELLVDTSEVSRLSSICIPMNWLLSSLFFDYDVTPSVCCEVAEGQGGGCFKYEGLRLSVLRFKASGSDQHGVQLEGPHFPVSGPFQQCAGYTRLVDMTVTSHLPWVLSLVISLCPCLYLSLYHEFYLFSSVFSILIALAAIYHLDLSLLMQYGVLL